MLQHFTNKSKRFQQLTILIVGLIVVGIGTYLLTGSYAAAPYTNTSASSGSLVAGSSGSASTLSCTAASSGTCVAFNPTNTGGGGTGSTGKLIVSINNATGYGDDANEPVTLFKNIDVTWTRVDSSAIAQTAEEGMNPFPTYETGNDGNCTGETPAAVQSAVAALVPTLEKYKVPYLEICNESYLSESDTAYAAQYNAAHVALAGSGVKAIAVATALASGCSSGGTTSPNWIPTVISDLPGGAAEVDGWSIHPYGPITGQPTGCGTGANGYGWVDVPDWHTIAVNAGSNAPWFITEVGQCLGNNNGSGNCSGPVSEATQAADMTTYLDDTATYPWVAFFNWYASCDDSTGDYGLIARENSTNGGTDNGVCDAGVRPAFTSMQTWMTQNASNVNG